MDGQEYRATIPQGVRETIGRRLSRLSADCSQALTIASVIGREFDFKVLKVLGGEVTEDGLLKAVDAQPARMGARVVCGGQDRRGAGAHQHSLAHRRPGIRPESVRQHDTDYRGPLRAGGLSGLSHRPSRPESRILGPSWRPAARHSGGLPGPRSPNRYSCRRTPPAAGVRRRRTVLRGNRLPGRSLAKIDHGHGVLTP